MKTALAPKKKLAACLCLFLALSPRVAGAILEPIENIPNKPLDDVLDDIITFILGLGILLSVLLIVWGGLNYVASVGDEERIKKAKKTIHYAILGTMIMGLSYAAIEVINDVLI